MLWSTPMTSRPASPSDRLDNGPHGSRCGGAPSRGTAHAQRSHACQAPWAVAARSRPSRKPAHQRGAFIAPPRHALGLTAGHGRHPDLRRAGGVGRPRHRGTVRREAGVVDQGGTDPEAPRLGAFDRSHPDIAVGDECRGRRPGCRESAGTVGWPPGRPYSGRHPPGAGRQPTPGGRPANEASIRPGRAFRCRGSLETGAGDSGGRHVRDGDGNYPRPATKQRHHRHHRGGARDGRESCTVARPWSVFLRARRPTDEIRKLSACCPSRTDPPPGVGGEQACPAIRRTTRCPGPPCRRCWLGPAG